LARLHSTSWVTPAQWWSITVS